MGFGGVNVDDWYRWGAASPFKNIVRVCEDVMTDGVIHLEMNLSHDLGDYLCTYEGEPYSDLKYVPASGTTQKNVSTFHHDNVSATLRVSVSEEMDPSKIQVRHADDHAGLFRDSYIEHLAPFDVLRMMVPQRMNHARDFSVNNSFFQGHEGRGCSSTILTSLLQAIDFYSPKNRTVWLCHHYQDDFDDFVYLVHLVHEVGWSVIAELGNEWFNTKTFHGAFAKQQAEDFRVWGAMAQGDFAERVKSSFGTQVKVVLGTQLMGPGTNSDGEYTRGTTMRMLDSLASTGQLDYFDAMAVQGYFGKGYQHRSSWFDDWKGMASDMFDRVFQHREWCRELLLDLYVYEANHGINNHGLKQAYNNIRIGEFYGWFGSRLLESTDVGMMYTDIQDPRNRSETRYDSWGLKDILLQDSDRYNAIVDVFSTSSPPPPTGNLDWETFVKYADRYMTERYPTTQKFENSFEAKES